ncbi:MAG TPA: hypothetical protein VJ742_05355 [Nitrososphaera sp.]|nr:hypothetical protein [Nitrososphaera sp.]
MLCVAAVALWSLSPPASTQLGIASAADDNIRVDGVIGSSGCKTIGGNIVIDTIDFVEPDRNIELCNYNDRYHFRIAYFESCVGAIGQWTDPTTGFTYIFSSACQAPRFFTEINCVDPVQIITEDRPYYVLLDTKNSSCNGFDFDRSEKKISMTIVATSLENRMNITIPSELLGGKFTLMIDRGGTEDFSVDEGQGYAKISFSKFCPLRCSYNVEITGTEVTSSELQRYSPPDGDVPLIMNARGERILELHVGQQAIVFGNFHNQNLVQSQPYTMLFEFRDEQGITNSIAWQSGVADPDSISTVGISWLPETRGEHQMRIQIISNFEDPRVLANGYSYSVNVS